MDFKKSSKIITALGLTATAALSVGACIKAKEKPNRNEYIDKVKSLNIFDNEYEQSLPQTVIYKLVMEHFNSPLPEGKTTKKTILLGYDGYRADGLENIMNNEDSAIMQIKKEGGLYYSFSGGISGVNEQETSTAQSWSAMLTGGWAGYNGVFKYNSKKKIEAETYLTKLAKQGKPASFTTSWREHTNTTYFYDTVYAIENGLPVTYTHQIDDEGTLYQVLKYVAKPEGLEKTSIEDPDAIFFTFEHTDHAGHDTGFGNDSKSYVKACKDADEFGKMVLDTIRARSTYDKEDWLIIITTDHGGKKKGHGGQSKEERTTWISCNKPIEMSEENLNFAIK